MNKIDFNITPIEGPRILDGDGAKVTCPMPIQKETPAGLIDTVCNGDIADHQAGLCRLVPLDSSYFF